MMNEKDYELICAYMDNELSDPERKKVQARLLEDKQFESKFLEFNKIDTQILEQYSAIDNKPVPQELLNLLADQHDETQSSQLEQEAIRIEKKSNKENKAWYQIGFSLAASALLVAFVSYFHFFDKQSNFDIKLSSILNSEISGKTINLEDNQKVHLSMSFLDRSGNWCREYFILANKTTQNIACLNDNGWQNLISVKAELKTGNSFMPASSNETVQIENWLDNNMDSDPLSTKQEQAFMLQD